MQSREGVEMNFDNSQLDIEAKYERDFRRTILIVDDEPVNLRLLGNILGEEYDVAYAQTGKEAISEIKKQKDLLPCFAFHIKTPSEIDLSFSA